MTLTEYSGQVAKCHSLQAAHLRQDQLNSGIAQRKHSHPSSPSTSSPATPSTAPDTPPAAPTTTDNAPPVRSPCRIWPGLRKVSAERSNASGLTLICPPLQWPRPSHLTRHEPLPSRMSLPLVACHDADRSGRKQAQPSWISPSLDLLGSAQPFGGATHSLSRPPHACSLPRWLLDCATSEVSLNSW